MRIHLIKKETIEGFVNSNSQIKKPFSDWIKAVEMADWNTPNNIKNTFGSEDLSGLGSNRIVFDIAGNNYRIICKYIFGEKEIHFFAEYEKLNKKTRTIYC